MKGQVLGFGQLREKHINKFIASLDNVRSIGSRYYWRGKQYAAEVINDKRQCTLRIDDVSILLTYPESEYAYSASFEIIDGSLFYTFLTRPTDGQETDVSTRFIPLDRITDGSMTRFELRPGYVYEVATLKKASSLEDRFVTVVADDKAPISATFKNITYPCEPSKFFNNIIELENGELLFHHASNYRKRMYTYLDGRYEPYSKYDDMTVVDVLNDSFVSVIHNDEYPFGALLKFRKKEDIDKQDSIMFEGSTDQRVYSTIAVLGGYIFVEMYDQNQSFSIGIFDSNGKSVGWDNMGLPIDIAHLLNTSPALEAEIPNIHILGVNRENMTMLIDSSRINPNEAIYNISLGSDGSLKAEKKPSLDFKLSSNKAVRKCIHNDVIPVSFSSGQTKVENWLYPEHTEIMSIYGGRYSMYSPSSHKLSKGRAFMTLRGLTGNRIDSAGSESDSRLSIRVNVDRPKDSQKFIPSIESALFIVDYLKHPEKKLIFEGGSLAGVSVLLTINTLLQMHVDGALDEGQLKSMFQRIVFSTISAVLDSAYVRPHNQDYYFSENIVRTRYSGHKDFKTLLKVARSRSPLTALPDFLSKTEVQKFLPYINITSFTYLGDKRCAIEPQRELMQKMHDLGVNMHLTEMKGSYHGYHSHKDNIGDIVDYWAVQAQMLHQH